jgi:hypothetical protein
MEVQAGSFDFSLRSGSVAGRCGHSPSPEPREKIKIPGSEWPQYVLKRFRRAGSAGTAAFGFYPKGDWR